MWSEKCDSDLFFAEIVWNDSFSWSCLIISSSIFWSSNLTFDEWRMLILDYWVTYVCSWFVERRLWWDVKLDETSHQTWRKRLIKLDESDSLNLTKETSSHQILTKASSYQIWDRRLIKLLRRKVLFLLFDERFHATTRDIKKKLNLAKDHFRFARK
jgi:hypothetical protein